MKNKINDILPQIKVLLIETKGTHITAEEIGVKLAVCTATVYKAIRHLREMGLGIMQTKKGYILSANAKPTDDVNYLRILLARRTSDYISMTAAMPDIKNRWNRIEGGSGRLLNLIEAPLKSGSSLFSGGVKALLRIENKLKV